ASGYAGKGATYAGKPSYGGDAGDGEQAGAPSDVGEAGQTGEAGAPATLLQQPSRGSPVALSPDESLALIVNRDVGSVTLLGLDRSKPGAPPTEVLHEIALGSGSEPWQVVFGPDGDTAFVVLRKDQRLVRIRYLKSEP